jgi:transforming growth factor-beta-induced protein
LFADKPLLTSVLTYHVLDGAVPKASIPLGQPIRPLGGGFFKIDAAPGVAGQAGPLTITDGRNRTAGITRTDVMADNGLIHVIDKVLLPANRDIVQTAQSVNDFSTLADAVIAAGLVETLKGPGPFTVFAPTNAAFAALLAELGVSRDALLADTTLLKRVLTYHVVPGLVLKAGIPFGQPIATVEGGSFVVDATPAITDARGRVKRLVTTDVLASNGVVHVIDGVLLPDAPAAPPPPAGTIVQIAQAAPDFSVLVEAVIAAGLVDALSSPGPLTVFAPTNEAFGKLLTELHLTKAQLLADKVLLGQVLSYHVVAGRIAKADVPVGQPITTLQGDQFTVDAALVITDARHRQSRITATDIAATNGVIHSIDTVLLPH